VYMYAYMTQLNGTRRAYLATRHWPKNNVLKTVAPKYAFAKISAMW